MYLNAGIRWFCRSFICLFLTFPIHIYCFKISSSGVLLPYNLGLPSNFTLEVSGSDSNECYQWQSKNPEIVRVTPVFSEGEHLPVNCARKALLSSVANLLEREVTEVSVTGHIFSSINGLEVKWNIYHHLKSLVEPSEEDKVISTSRFDISDYDHPEKRNEFEKRGLLSTSVLVEPIELGSAVISATLLLSSVPALKTPEIKLNVISSLKFQTPSPLYVIRNAEVNVKLEKNKKDVNLEDFVVEADNPEVINLSEDKLHFHATEYGSSSIIYENKNNIDSSILNVHTVELDHIGFRVSGGNYSILEEMKIYECMIDLYDKDGNKIYASNNIRFSVSFPAKLFHVLYTSSNGTYSVIQTIAPGNGKIRAEFKGVLLQDESISKEYVITGTLGVKVFQKLSIFPPFSLLPVLPEQPMHKIRLTIAGGSGEYVWALSNYEVAKLIEDEQKKNVVHLEVYKEVHDLKIIATDRKNINFITSAKVSVQTPLDIEAYPTVTEAEVGNVLIVPAALLGYENKEKEVIRKFDDCSKADIKIDIVEKHILSFEKEADIPAFGKGCISLQFRCKMPGHSRVNMEYSVPSSNITYKTTTVLACYKPLKPVHPVRVAVLALGTSIEVGFDGGPRKWPLFKEGHYTELEASNPDIVGIQLIKDPIRYNKDLTVFRVSCKVLGENTLTFRIGNNPSATIKHPAKSEASIKFICGEPFSSHLKLFKEKTKRKLKDENIVKVPFYGEKAFTVDIFVKDAMGRKFANISSLHFVWDVSDRSLANPVSDFDFVNHENAVSGYRKLSRKPGVPV